MNRTPNSIWMVRMGGLSCQPAPAPFGGHHSATPPLSWWPPPLPVFRAARTPARDGRPSRGHPHRILPKRSPPSSGRELIRQTSRRSRRRTARSRPVSPSRRTLWLPARRRRPRATRSAPFLSALPPSPSKGPSLRSLARHVGFTHTPSFNIPAVCF